MITKNLKATTFFPSRTNYFSYFCCSLKNFSTFGIECLGCLFCYLDWRLYLLCLLNCPSDYLHSSSDYLNNMFAFPESMAIYPVCLDCPDVCLDICMYVVQSLSASLKWFLDCLDSLYRFLYYYYFSLHFLRAAFIDLRIRWIPQFYYKYTNSGGQFAK